MVNGNLFVYFMDLIIVNARLISQKWPWASSFRKNHSHFFNISSLFLNQILLTIQTMLASSPEHPLCWTHLSFGQLHNFEVYEIFYLIMLNNLNPIIIICKYVIVHLLFLTLNSWSVLIPMCCYLLAFNIHLERNEWI